MILTLNIPDDKVALILDVLQKFPFVKQEIKIINETSNALTNNEIDIMKYVKPMRSFTVEDLIREQNYQGFDEAKFNELAAIIDMQSEPLDVILEAIK